MKLKWKGIKTSAWCATFSADNVSVLVGYGKLQVASYCEDTDAMVTYFLRDNSRIKFLDWVTKRRVYESIPAGAVIAL